jgi:tetratricopeptide (TPR) repeat protein
VERRETERLKAERLEAERREAEPREAERREYERLRKSEPREAGRREFERREPAADWDDIEFRSDTRWLPPARPRRSAWPWWLAVACVLAVVALLFVLRQPLADRLWPETRAQALLAQADAALAQGRLTATDGSSARELYEAALAIDPDRSEARVGLTKVAAAALAQARTALAQERFADARNHLALARALSVPKAQADAFAEELRQRESGHAGIDGLVARAETARREGRLDGDGAAALPLYQRVLELQPENAVALRGREDALSDLLGAARESLRKGDLRDAAAKIEVARKYDPGHVDLPDSVARLTEETDTLRRRADEALRRDNLQQAAESYRALLAFSADDAAATQGLARVAAAHAARAQRLAADFEFEDAEAELSAARELAPEAAEVREAASRLERSRQASARTSSVPSAQRQSRVRALLNEAAAASVRGDLLTPPGESAFDKLGAARALAPRDPAVTQASARLLPAAQACFERELRGNNLTRARSCLDARGVLGEDAGTVSQARRRLAQRWLAVGDERLGAGELQAASSALNAARGLDPGAPGINEFAERLRTATTSRN